MSYSVTERPRGASWIAGILALGLLAGMAVVLWTSSSASAQQTVSGRVFAVTTTDNLVSFNRADPGRIVTNRPITGMRPGESMVGIDHRPATGALFGIGSTSQVYAINRSTAVARRVGAQFTPALSGTQFGVDFNPVVDRIRVVSNTDQNLRLNPDTGATAAVDTPLQYGAMDRNAGANPNVVGSAYANNMDGVTTTELYGIDSGLNILVTQNPPNDGTLMTDGPLGVNTVAQVGFDTAPGYGALASLTPVNMKSRLYSVNLMTGDTTDRGKIGTRPNIRDIAIPLQMP